MFLIPYGNHAQLGGVSVVERFMGALPYGWVERCNDVASCGTRFFQNKYFLCAISATVSCLMNCDEHVECFDECIYLHCMIAIVCIYVCLLSMNF